MELRIFTEPQQGATYDDTRAVARASETEGFDGLAEQLEVVTGMRANGAAWLPGEVVETLHRFGAAGAQRVYLQVLDLGDLDHLSLLGRQVLPEAA